MSMLLHKLGRMIEVKLVNKMYEITNKRIEVMKYVHCPIAINLKILNK